MAGSFRTGEIVFKKERLRKFLQEYVGVHGELDLNFSEIGERFGFGRGVVQRMCDELGIPRGAKNGRFHG